jgi:hypothetical protein
MAEIFDHADAIKKLKLAMVDMKPLPSRKNPHMKTVAELSAHWNSEEKMKSGRTVGEWLRDGVCPLGEKDVDWKIGAHGEVRWVSSDNIVPEDCLEMAVVDGVISIQDREATLVRKPIETREFFEKYSAWRDKVGYSEEEKAIMRSEMEPGERLVDAGTGKYIDL